jgi:hypothetical protein
MNRNLLQLVFCVVFTLFLNACSDGAAAPQSGGVYMANVSQASVAVYEIAADGAVSPLPAAMARTADDGSFSLARPAHYPVLVRASGGSYLEEATGERASLSGELDAVYLSAPTTIVVSPYSNAIVIDAIAAGGLSAENIAAASARVNAFVGGIDVQQTVPVYPPASDGAAVSDGAKMAFALGAESQSRSDNGLAIAASSQAIVDQAANGDTLARCHTGAGDVLSDGSVAAADADHCLVTSGAAAFAHNAYNRTGVTSLAMLEPAQQTAPQLAAASACGDRVALLTDNLALFEGRKNSVQALLAGGMTDQNWSTFQTPSRWGPFARGYGAIEPPANCTDMDTFKRELVMAAENFWVDQNINYCHHHVPGWLPPDDSNGANPKYRNSTPESTSGESAGGNPQQMTCTGQRNANGAQSVQVAASDTPASFPAAAINWKGVDCSDYTAWIYNFAGMTSNDLSTGIGTQACSTADRGGSDANPSPDVLLDINQGNFDAMQSYLRPGDLLYITQENALTDSGEFTGGYKLAHVVTWTGKHWNDLQAGTDAARYDIDRIGQPDSRLGGDFKAHLDFDVSQLGKTAKTDPWMIIDSHYAGPAYRPFLGWYRTHLSHVRRIIGADAARTDPVLAAYVIAPVSQNAQHTQVVLGSAHAGSGAASGYRMIYDDVQGKQACYRAGTAQ